MPIALRAYLPGDEAAMHALDLECFAPVFQFSRRAIRGFALAAHAVTLLAYTPDSLAHTPDALAHTPDALAGFVIVHRRSADAYVVTLDVAPALRRAGIGRILLQQAERRVQAAGAANISLHVSVENSSAIRFYESLGYQLQGPTRDFYAAGRDALLYRRSL